MKIELFANLKSGRGRGRAIADDLVSRLRAEKYDVSVSLLHPDAMQTFSAPDVLIIIGGDGTLRTVLDRARQFTAPLPPTLLIPLGTANLMTRHLGMKWDRKHITDKALQLIRQRNIRAVDAAECNGKLFLLMATVGIDAAIVHQLASKRRGPIRLSAYISPTLDAIWSYRQSPMTITVDGQRIVQNQKCFAYVGNVREYGTGFSIASQAKSDDSLLDICIFPNENQLDLLQLSVASALSTPMGVAGSIYCRGREISIHSDEPVPMQVDGDPGGFTPADIRLLPWSVPFIVE